jgi:hypothetical protein
LCSDRPTKGGGCEPAPREKAAAPPVTTGRTTTRPTPATRAASFRAPLPVATTRHPPRPTLPAPHAHWTTAIGLALDVAAPSRRSTPVSPLSGERTTPPTTTPLRTVPIPTSKISARTTAGNGSGTVAFGRKWDTTPAPREALGVGKCTTGVYSTLDKSPIRRLAAARKVPRRRNATVPKHALPHSRRVAGKCSIRG